MKNSTHLLYGAFLIAFILITGCIIQNNPKLRIAADLIGHTTGGRESSWKFKTGDTVDLKILSDTPNEKTISVITGSDENGAFFQVLKLTYSNGKLITVGQLYIQKL
jgi:hypothetical protein